MHGDFSRDTFDAAKHFSRVLMQQGRVQLDSDFNEQDAIVWWRLRHMARDLIGRHAASSELPDSFKVAAIDISGGGYAPRDFSIAAGRYYVEGILCENDAKVQYTKQPSFSITNNDDTAALMDRRTYLVYLDVWERQVTFIEDPLIREVALGGPDTCTRAKVEWQVRVSELTSEQASNPADTGEDLLDQFLLSAGLHSSKDPLLRVRSSPDTHYRGAENRLYRVEIHQPGVATDATSGREGKPTFKWSRDNGATIFPIDEISGSEVRLSNFAQHKHPRLQVGDWVEVVDQEYELRGMALPLVQVTHIQRGDRQVRLSRSVPDARGREPALHPYVRRWDQRDGVDENGTVPIVAHVPEGWTQVEDGVEIRFSDSGNYRTGDYWMIPARTATADVEWPAGRGGPSWVAPQGIMHCYAPLAKLKIDAAGAPEVLKGYRRRVMPLSVLQTADA
jgi:hypothetical protein